MSDDELEAIKHRKMMELMQKMAEKQQENKQEAVNELAEKKEMVLRYILLPDALNYLGNLRKTKPKIVEQIEDAIIVLVAYRKLQRKLDKIDIMRIERKLEGVEPRIMIKRRGDDHAIDIEEKLKSLIKD
ncbi:MAG: DNA-binding protein [Candidatus Jordarchaeum sp.]|uniref:DNA-binding protein n=1 Tax=Candidatus Jordarchaeum sp. TaxID=2823881 RepID=UPI00404AA298